MSLSPLYFADLILSVSMPQSFDDYFISFYISMIVIFLRNSDTDISPSLPVPTDHSILSLTEDHSLCLIDRFSLSRSIPLSLYLCASLSLRLSSYQSMINFILLKVGRSFSLIHFRCSLSFPWISLLFSFLLHLPLSLLVLSSSFCWLFPHLLTGDGGLSWLGLRP